MSRLIDPPARRGWVNQLTPLKASTKLIRDYLASRVKHVEVGPKSTSSTLLRKAESLACKSMLKAHTEANRIPMAHAGNVELVLVPAEKGGMVILCYIPGTGSMPWLPRLITTSNATLAQIKKETSINRVIINEDKVALAADQYGDVPSRLVPPTTPTRFIPGQQIPSGTKGGTYGKSPA